METGKTWPKLTCIFKFCCLDSTLSTGKENRPFCYAWNYRSIFRALNVYIRPNVTDRSSNVIWFIPAKVVKSAAGVCGRKPLCVTRRRSKGCPRPPRWDMEMRTKPIDCLQMKEHLTAEGRRGEPDLLWTFMWSHDTWLTKAMTLNSAVIQLYC